MLWRRLIAIENVVRDLITLAGEPLSEKTPTASMKPEGWKLL
jgi:hypothetical protein